MLYQIPPRNSTGKDDIAYWEGFFSDEEIKNILNIPNWEKRSTAVVGGGRGYEANLEIRRSDVAWLNVTPESDWIWKKIVHTVAEVNRRFFRYDLTGCYEAIQLSEYTESDSGHYDWHIDGNVASEAVPRKLSMTLLLSDPSEFEGGDLQVMVSTNKPKTLEAKKGRAWFFPSHTLHRVTPVTRGVRRSLVLWVGGPEFK
jgi:PKHD-type hydroxylase